jgi:membrane protease YdiL (CAAX protease family)
MEDTRTTAPSDDRPARALRGFGPAGVVAMLAIVLSGNLVGAALVFVWALASGTPLRKLGFVRPGSWPLTVTVGVVAGVGLKLLMKTVVLPLAGFGPINPTYSYLVGNRAALPGTLFLMVVGGGFGEETIWRGFLFDRFDALFGGAAAARPAIVLVTSALFAMAHYPDQGVAGAAQALVTGIVFGTMFAATRTLWLSIAAHAAYDVAAVLIIYFDVESSLAHAIFR